MSGRDASKPADSRAIQAKVRELRSASFSSSRKGFDRDEVMTYLHRLAAWLEGAGLAHPEEVRRELTMVGKRTSEILTKADETATALRSDAQQNAHQLVESASAEAERIRREAEEDVTRMRREAEARAEEAVDDADRRAERMIDEAIKRRQDLELVIDDLLAGREEILADTRRLVDELNALVGRGSETEQEETAEPELEEEEAEVESETAAIAAMDEEDGLRRGELDGEPDFSLRDRGEEAGETAEPDGETAEQDALDPDTEEHSPERA